MLAANDHRSLALLPRQAPKSPAIARITVPVVIFVALKALGDICDVGITVCRKFFSPPPMNARRYGTACIKDGESRRRQPCRGPRLLVGKTIRFHASQGILSRQCAAHPTGCPTYSCSTWLRTSMITASVFSRHRSAASSGLTSEISSLTLLPVLFCTMLEYSSPPSTLASNTRHRPRVYSD